jgi:hypothetical protein
MTNYPTDKQIAYILRLINGRYDSDAFRAIAEDMGCAPSAASRRATKGDASRTIERLTAGRPAHTERTYRTAYGDVL